MHRRSAYKQQAGFGLVELMVSISIMVIVASIILVGQSTFNGAVLLRGQAYEVALQVREVQLSSVSASGDAGDFRVRYGIHFTPGASGYTIFQDDGDGFYDAGDTLFGPQGLLDSRFTIGDVKLGGVSVGASGASIIFVRPNFDAIFYDATNSQSAESTMTVELFRDGAVGNGCGAVRTLEVTNTGQIAVLDCP